MVSGEYVRFPVSNFPSPFSGRGAFQILQICSLLDSLPDDTAGPTSLSTHPPTPPTHSSILSCIPLHKNVVRGLRFTRDSSCGDRLSYLCKKLLSRVLWISNFSDDMYERWLPCVLLPFEYRLSIRSSLRSGLPRMPRFLLVPIEPILMMSREDHHVVKLISSPRGFNVVRQ